MIRGARILHVSGITQAISGSACDAAFAAIDAATAAGALVTYDPNLRLKLWSLPRASAVIRATAGMCNFFLPSLDDIRVLSGATDPMAAAAWCRGIGAPIVVLKCGARRRDRLVRSPRRAHRRPLVATVDATGAGDCFDGAFAARTIAGDDPVTAARYANAAAALATTGFGAVAPLPRDADVRALLESAR